MLNIFLFTSFFIFSKTFLFYSYSQGFTQKTVYLDQLSTSPIQDGSQENPYSSLEEAFSSFMGTPGGEIIFMRDSFTIPGNLPIASNQSLPMEISFKYI